MKQFKPTRDMIKVSETVFECMASVETINPIVRGYQQKILDYEKYCYDKKWIERGLHTYQEWISDPEHAYLMSDADFTHYLKRCNEERKKANLHVRDENYCPLLTAENLLTKANKLLIDVMEPIAGLSYDMLLGSGGKCLENLAEAVSLNLRLLAPYCKNRYTSCEVPHA